MKDNGWMTSKTDLEKNLGQMELSFKVSIQMERRKVKENSLGRMVLNIKDSL